MTADPTAVKAASAQGVDVDVYRLLQCAFPQGFSEQFYSPILSIL
jgi:hypothetical protein